MTSENIIQMITEEIADALEVPVSEISPDEDFMEMGLTSLEAIKLINTIKDRFNLPDIGPALIFEYHSIHELSEHLYGMIVETAH